MCIWKIIDQFTNGIPDAYYGGAGGRSLWIEYKLTKRKTPPKSLDVSPLNNNSGKLSSKQQQWLNAHADRGHNVAVVMIHYKPRNTEYYVMREGQWNTKQDTSDLLRFNQQGLLDWIMSETGMSGYNNNEQIAT